jgi:hypothetical protein
MDNKNNKYKPVYEPTADMRTNPLGKVPGGSTVTIVYEKYRVDYNNIKNPKAYTNAIKFKAKEEIVEILVNGKTIKL